MFPIIKEASLPFNNSFDALRGHVRIALMAKLGVTDPWVKGPWIVDLFPTAVVYQFDNATWRIGYTSTQNAAGTPPTITIKGDAVKVHMAFMDNKESAKEILSLLMEDQGVTVTQEDAPTVVTEGVEYCIGLEEMVETLKEGAKTAASTGKATVIPVKVIKAGWGSSAYYSKEVLQRDGPLVFKAGTHMYWNHATEAEEEARPAGDLNNLAAVFMEDAHWDEKGVKGPGLYTEVKVFSDYATQVMEKGPHIGVSINAAIRTHEGTVEGKKGPIADKFIHAFSTDFVTKAGAGGAPIVPVQESQRARLTEDIMTDEQIKALEEKNKDLEKQLKESRDRDAASETQRNQMAAFEAISKTLKEADIPFNEKLLKRSCANPTMKEGKIDDKWLEAIVTDFSEGHEGAVEGLGEKKTPKDANALKESESSLVSNLQRLGMDETTAKEVGRFN